MVAVLLALGVFFRFTNLGKKIYQHDEAMTSLRVAGFRVEEVRQQLADGHEIDIGELQRYQRVSPERGVRSTLTSLATDDPKHTPLFYLLARLWTQVFGDSVVALRSLAALISLLTLPCLFWLGKELFASSRIAWMVVMLVAVSPFHILYAQESRQYSLWTLATVLSSAALLRALRLQTWRGWSLYATTLAMGLYTHMLFAFVPFAHGIYMAGTHLDKSMLRRLRLSRLVTDYLLFTVVAFLLFVPWASFIVFGLPVLYETTNWLTRDIEPLFFLKRWILGVSSPFLDTSGGVLFYAKAGLENWATYWVRLPILLLIAYSFFSLCRNTSRRVWLFVVALTGGTILPLLLTDLVMGWRTSTPARYLTPGYLGIQLSVAYLLASQIVSPRPAWRRLWQMVTVVLIAGEIVSCIRSAQAATWWSKEASYILPRLAQIVNQSPRPLLVSALERKNFGNIIAFSYLLEPKVRFRAVEDPDMALREIKGFSDVFVLNPSEQFQQELQKKDYLIRPVVKSGELWKLVKEPSP
jgi:uncharacterized membrane protein